jgi:hypothetical protein
LNGWSMMRAKKKALSNADIAGPKGVDFFWLSDRKIFPHLLYDVFSPII